MDRELAEQRFIADVYEDGPSRELVRKLRTWVERIGGRMFTAKEPIVDQMNEQRNHAMRQANEYRVRIEQAKKLKENDIEPGLSDAEVADLRQKPRICTTRPTSICR